MIDSGDRTGTDGWPQSEWPELAPEPLSPVTPLLRPPTFSVVVAAYQAQASLAVALQSALGQSVPPLEVVVCDDGSTDGTAEVLQTFGSTVRSFRQPNRGEGAAKNAAVEAARGQFVVVLDADDEFDRRRLEALGRLAMRRPDLDLLTTDAIVEADGVPVRQAYHDGWPFAADSQRIAILQRNFVFGLAAVRRSRWLGVGGFETAITAASDWDFWMRLILSGSGVGLVAAPLARYRLTTGTLSSDRQRMVEARLTVLQRAAARPDLSAEERRVVRTSIAQQRRERLARRAQAALATGGWSARVAHGRVLVGRGFPTRTRASAVFALIAPSRARRRTQRVQGDTVEIGSGLRVPVNRSAAQPPPAE